MIRNLKSGFRNSLTKNEKFFVKVFGCQYNEWDAIILANFLHHLGMQESDEVEADFVFILNCSIRKSAVDRAFGAVKNYLAQNKKVYLSGCVLDYDKQKLQEKGVIFFDTSDLENLSKLLKLEKIDSIKFARNYKLTNFVPIMKGCNNFCSYCVVPYTRGREVSRRIDDVITDVEKIIQSGQKEIWLLGQNVNSYQYGLAKLLKKTNDLPGDFVIKFSSNHPKDMTEEIIETVANLPKVAKYIHLPLQSASNKVLRSMNRPYTIEKYEKIIQKITAAIPTVELTTDIIVGYPTETEEDFQKTADFVRKTNFNQAYINKYSPRKGTKSYDLGDPVSWAEKERRWRILNNLVNIKK